MLSKNTLKEKYKVFIGNNKDLFLNELSFVKDNINAKGLEDKPMLIYSNNKRNAIYFYIMYALSLKKDRVLDYAVITGQNLINQHFLPADQRDTKLYGDIYYTDVTFISLSQFDYTSEYLESLIIDLIESRTLSNKTTVITFDIMQSKGYVSTTKKLNTFFSSRGYKIVHLGLDTPNSTKPDNENRVSKKKRLV